jgi:hypothetical protein
MNHYLRVNLYTHLIFIHICKAMIAALSGSLAKKRMNVPNVELNVKKRKKVRIVNAGDVVSRILIVRVRMGFYLKRSAFIRGDAFS